MENKAFIVAQGVCPKCKSENIEYWHTNSVDTRIGYEFECLDCGCRATEWYELIYTETVED